MRRNDTLRYEGAIAVESTGTLVRIEEVCVNRSNEPFAYVEPLLGGAVDAFDRNPSLDELRVLSHLEQSRLEGRLETLENTRRS